MTLDQHAKVAAANVKRDVESDFDADALLSKFHNRRARQKARAWLAAAAVAAAFTIGVVGWLSVSNNTQSDSQPINRPSVPSPAPSPPAPSPHLRNSPEEFSLVMGPADGMGPKTIAGPDAEVTLNPPSHWYIVQDGSFLDLRTGPESDPAQQVGVMMLAGPLRAPGPEAPSGEAIDAEAIRRWMAADPGLSVKVLAPTEVAGSPALTMTVSETATKPGRSGIGLFMILNPNSFPGRVFTLNFPDPLYNYFDHYPPRFSDAQNQAAPSGRQQETLIIAEEETGWPLVIRIWGSSQLVNAHASEIQQLVDSITITPTD